MFEWLKIRMEERKIRDELFGSIHEGITNYLNEKYSDPTKLLKEYYRTGEKRTHLDEVYEPWIVETLKDKGDAITYLITSYDLMPEKEARRIVESHIEGLRESGSEFQQRLKELDIFLRFNADMNERIRCLAERKVKEGKNPTEEFYRMIDRDFLHLVRQSRAPSSTLINRQLMERIEERNENKVGRMLDMITSIDKMFAVKMINKVVVPEYYYLQYLKYH